MKILFSPIGTRDPISEENYHDGSMLHICRWYKIDKVYMYLSKDMWEKKEKDNRYEIFIKHLAEKQNRKIDIEPIEGGDSNNVHRYDVFYNKFKKYIDEEIIKNMKKDDELYINVSSGTPAMKIALVLLQNLKEYDSKLIQVEAPENVKNETKNNAELSEKLLKAKNSDKLSEELLELLKAENDRVEEKAKNRCIEEKNLVLSRLSQESLIKKFINEYDYKAAYNIANRIKENLGEEAISSYIKGLEAAKYRVDLKFENVDSLVEKADNAFRPIEDRRARELYEYTLCLDIHVKRGEYINFIRGITPIIVELFEEVLKSEKGIDIRSYCYQDEKDIWRWAGSIWHERNGRYLAARRNICAILEGFDKSIEDILKKNKDELKSDFIKSADLLSLIKVLLKENKDLVKLATKLRDIECGVRNIAAHEIIALDDNMIKERTGFDSLEIMKKIKKLFEYTNFNIKEEYWNSYEEMNKIIINLIG